MEPKEILDVAYGLTLPEANRRLPRGTWGRVYPLAHEGYVIGLVTLLEPEVWFRPCGGPTGVRMIQGRWRLQAKPAPGLPRGSKGWSHAVLDNV
jgi:hypothetical protein